MSDLRMEVSGRINDISVSYKIVAPTGEQYAQRLDLEEAMQIAERIGGEVEVIETALIGLCSYKVDGETVSIKDEEDEYEPSFRFKIPEGVEFKKGYGFNLKAESINESLSNGDELFFEPSGAFKYKTSEKFNRAKSLADFNRK